MGASHQVGARGNKKNIYLNTDAGRLQPIEILKRNLIISLHITA
jgi:hypothetical protein